MQLRQFISKTIREHLSENIEDYLKWKRKNVTLRGIKELGKSNDAYGSFGSGLYTVPLSNKAMAKQYGNVYFVVNAIPKNPKIVDSLNSAELLRQRLVNDFCIKNNKNYDMRFFYANTSMENEMLNLGYDGLIIKGREMVNYAPSDIKYFKTEDELQRYYSKIRQISEVFENKNVEYIYHGTGKGQAINIQRDGYMKPNKTGEEQPSISFTVDLDYAKYYAKSKGGNDKMCILRTNLTDDFHLSPRIVNNKGDEYVTFKNVPSTDLQVMTADGNWQPLDNWNVIFDEPIQNYKFVNENITTDDYDDFFSDSFEETEYNYHKSRKEIYEDVYEFMKNINELKNPIKLYRIIQAKSHSDINLNNLGIHCKLNDNFSKQFLRDININIEDIINGEYNLYVVVVSIDKKYIDFSNTIKNNIKYPDEEEITIYENSKYNVEDVYEYL